MTDMEDVRPKVTHDEMVLAYLFKMGRSNPLLASEIERAKLLVERDLMQAEIARLKPLQAVPEQANEG